MTRTWILAYWSVAVIAVFQIFAQANGPVGPQCAMKRTEYRIAILGVEWVKRVRETPLMLADCAADRRTGGPADGTQ